MTARYAIYFCPETESALYRLGTAWLGYDAAAGADVAPDLPAGLGRADWRAATDAPRAYGFHATLKPPFRLADGTDEAGLREALAAFAASRPPVGDVALALDDIDGFLALAPAGEAAALYDLADACVAQFDTFRAPPSEAELARRRAGGLTDRQEAHLRRWGYPYVMDTFRFHMTLTGRLDMEARTRFRAILAGRFAEALARPVPVGSVCLFVQPSAESRFELRDRFVLAG